ncbi:Vacuolar protein sorting-associated protein 62 [Ceratocystis pirilliformis]|uniref:Vacuolar protein sorting-associated protein 62 n=1 Tax=Ceratocystis pirilliformis TaxID=259994 RepID=A0ABR3ZND8_9PEZI
MGRSLSLSRLRYLIFFGLLFFSASLGTWLIPRVLNPVPPTGEKRRADRQWIGSSHYWLDRQACRWLSLCGIQHIRVDPPGGKHSILPTDHSNRLSLELRSLVEDQNQTYLAPENMDEYDDPSAFYDADEPIQLDDLEGDEGSPSALYHSWQMAHKPSLPRPKLNSSQDPTSGTILRSVPQYVFDHAPLVHLYSNEHFWPSDIEEHVRHMHVTVDTHGNGMNPVAPAEPLSLDTLSQLNNLSETNKVFLASVDDVEGRPTWLFNSAGRPGEWDDSDDESDPSHDDPGHGHPDPKMHAKIPHDEQWLQEGTTWFDVKPTEPLNRITDPRRLPGSMKKHYRRQSSSGQQRLEADEEKDGERGKPNSNGYSSAPATLIVVDKGSGIVDAFWFFFYSYNLGQTVLNVRFGNHVGDWEHAMVRFENGVPRGVFFSEHEGGQAYAWGAVEKRGSRPVIYSAVGSHAMYAMPGLQPYILPFKLLKDVTDKGPLWDPAQNSRMYFYEYDRPEPENSMANPNCLTPAMQNPDAPVDWFFYTGAWGDRLYPLADKRQWRLFSQYHYVNGPTGPIWKNLNRERMCQTKRCVIAHSLMPGRTWYG